MSGSAQTHVSKPERRAVTRAEFEQIACNRCGACCEVVWQPSPLAMAVLLGRNVVVGDVLGWWSDLEPISSLGASAGGRNGRLQKYRCLRFARDENGLGVCTQYESRPMPCATFPDCAPVHAEGFEACSWNVSIIGEEEIAWGG